MPGVGLGVLIFNELSQVLLILRNSDNAKAKSDMHLEGTWTLPAGKVKRNETLFVAAKRKALEEVNLEIEDLKIVSIADDINEHAHFVTFGIEARMCSGNIDLSNSEEHVDYKFFALNNMPENLCEPSKKIIENYLNNCIYKGE